MNSKITNISLHSVGNKSAEELLLLSKQNLNLADNVKEILDFYFTNAFKTEEYFQFFHDTDLSLNESYTYISDIFTNPETLLEQSVNLAKHLYEQSTHPKIKGGEFYTVYFRDCVIDGETVDAVGLFKSENKDTFLKVFPKGDSFEIESEKGININKLDKGCLIFNTEKENGYIVAVVDNTNKGVEAQYWIDDFLHVRQRKDEYYNTNNVLTLCKDFVKNEFPKQFESNQVQRTEILENSIKFFKEKETFVFDDFVNEVMQQPEVIDSFNNYTTDYQKNNDIEIANEFSISESAVKKQSRVFKSVIKLDKNFHIYVHGNRQLIEQGEDEKGKFYKVYYKEEA
ncbi:MAG: nucleoid-associated protein [Bacteroidales bacterium]|nr:nucleoid-associated protein [Bacteroidales bacterium]